MGETLHRKERDLTLDVLKGIGIILMVMGHSGFRFEEYIYLFHMALFFMASGYVWNDKKVDSFRSLWKAILSRIRGLWLPYVIANGAFTLFNNVFVALGLYEAQKYLAPKQIVVNFVKNLCFVGDTSLGGASWFLRTMFLISVAHLVIRFVVTKVKWGEVAFGLVAVLTVAAAEIVSRKRMILPMSLHTCFFGYVPFLMGFYLRKLNLMEKWKKLRILPMLAGAAVLFFLQPFGAINPSVGRFPNVGFYIAVSLAGWFMVYYLASFLTGWIGKVLSYCGRHSIWVVLMHFLAFKAVIFGYVCIAGKPASHLADSPIYYVPGLWIVYTVCGTALPLLVCFGVHKFRRSRRKKEC